MTIKIYELVNKNYLGNVILCLFVDNGDDGGTSAGKASQPIPAENCNEKIQNQPDLPKNDGPSPSAGESSQISDQPLPPNANANVSKKYLKRLAKKAQFGEKLKEKR